MMRRLLPALLIAGLLALPATPAFAVDDFNIKSCLSTAETPEEEEVTGTLAVADCADTSTYRIDLWHIENVQRSTGVFAVEFASGTGNRSLEVWYKQPGSNTWERLQSTATSPYSFTTSSSAWYENASELIVVVRGQVNASMPYDYTLTIPTAAVPPQGESIRILGARMFSPVEGGSLLIAELDVDGGSTVGGDAARPELMQEDILVEMLINDEPLAATRVPRLFNLYGGCFGFNCHNPDGQGPSAIFMWVPKTADVETSVVKVNLLDKGAVVSTIVAAKSDSGAEISSTIRKVLRELGRHWAVELVAGERLTSDGIVVLEATLPQARQLDLDLINEQLDLNIREVDEGDADEQLVPTPDFGTILTAPFERTAFEFGVALTSVFLVAGIGFIFGIWMFLIRVGLPRDVAGAPVACVVVPLATGSGMLGIYGFLIPVLVFLGMAILRFMGREAPSG